MSASNLKLGLSHTVYTDSKGHSQKNLYDYPNSPEIAVRNCIRRLLGLAPIRNERFLSKLLAGLPREYIGSTFTEVLIVRNGGNLVSTNLNEVFSLNLMLTEFLDISNINGADKVRATINFKNKYGSVFSNGDMSESLDQIADESAKLRNNMQYIRDRHEEIKNRINKEKKSSTHLLKMLVSEIQMFFLSNIEGASTEIEDVTGAIPSYKSKTTYKNLKSFLWRYALDCILKEIGQLEFVVICEYCNEPRTVRTGEKIQRYCGSSDGKCAKGIKREEQKRQRESNNGQSN